MKLGKDGKSIRAIAKTLATASPTIWNDLRGEKKYVHQCLYFKSTEEPPEDAKHSLDIRIERVGLNFISRTESSGQM